MFNLEILESTLLLILLVSILRSGFGINQFLLIVLTILTVVFLILSLLKFLKLGSFWTARFLLVVLLVAVLYGFWIAQNVAKRDQNSTFGIHDGVILTDAATKAILSGKNPYAISYQDEFANFTNKPSSFTYNHFMYSPLTFLINVPQALILKTLSVSDFRITLTIFLIMAVALGTFIVKEKLLFLIIFALNPLFIPLTFYGANEVIILFFLLAALAFLKNGKITLSTVMVALATDTKLLALPFVPLYFMYVYLQSQKSKVKSQKFILKQLMIFLIISLVIYLPFMIWSFRDFVEDVVFYHLVGGQELHIIAGFVGIPQLLVNLGLIASTSNFPFYIFQGLIAGLLLVPIWQVLKKSPNLAALTVAFVFYFIAILLFSRIIQTTYLAFISQMLCLSAFLSRIRVEGKD